LYLNRYLTVAIMADIDPDTDQLPRLKRLRQTLAEIDSNTVATPSKKQKVTIEERTELMAEFDKVFKEYPKPRGMTEKTYHREQVHSKKDIRMGMGQLRIDMLNMVSLV
jgi:hypothetical protein